ncbi:MAG: PilZ domain-containing protein [Thermodesulfobacteriota bacterium]|nr:PilZ domain-containing protein [Thermodesulfobacteriota bacterium]
MKEQRHYQRLKFGFQIEDINGKKTWMTEDISVGGCFIKALEDMPVGSKINLAFQIPGSPKYINALGEVKHLQERGMGIEFINVETKKRNEMGLFIKQFLKFQDKDL